MNSLIDLIFPRVCTVCRATLVDGEDIMCLGCLSDMPLTGDDPCAPNEIHKRLVSLKAPLQRAVSLYHYVPGTPYVTLVHDTKYNHRPVVGRTLAARHAGELLKTGFFDGIDVIIPIPLHFAKRWIRGYNQAEEIARGLSDATGLPVGDNLRARHYRFTQTRRGLEQRRLNSADVFHVVHPAELEGLHALIVDDVITTGSTILAGLEAIHASSPSTLLSVYSLALTHLA